MKIEKCRKLKVTTDGSVEFPYVKVVDAESGETIDDVFYIKYEASVDESPCLTLKIRNPEVDIQPQGEIEVVDNSSFNSQWREFVIKEKEENE